jgi:arabinogalactan endo-1,4-beta-galactosidase
MSTAFRYSLSLSPFTEQMLREGIRYSDGEATATNIVELQTMFRRHGATEIYARIGTLRVTNSLSGGAEHGWARGLERAQLAAQLGMPFNPEIGLFASYGDCYSYQEPPDFSDYPQIQLPGPWLSLDIEMMSSALRDYGMAVARQIVDTGAEIVRWDLGNEVDHGICGVAIRPYFPKADYQPPNGVDPEIGHMSAGRLILLEEPERLDWLRAHVWPHLARLLAATAQGIRSVDPGATFSTHIAGVGARSTQSWLTFWETMKENGYLPDEFGISLYPTCPYPHYPDGGVEVIEAAARQLYSRWGKKTFLAEYGYPSSVMPAPFSFNREVTGYPLNTDGQARFLADLAARGRKEGWLAGIRPWAPDFLSQGWQSMAYFEKEDGLATARGVLFALDPHHSPGPDMSSD